MEPAMATRTNSEQQMASQNTNSVRLRRVCEERRETTPENVGTLGERAGDDCPLCSGTGPLEAERATRRTWERGAESSNN